MSICLVVVRIGFVNTYPGRFIPTKNTMNVVGSNQQETGLLGMESGQAVANHATGRCKETGLGVAVEIAQPQD